MSLALGVNGWPYGCSNDVNLLYANPVLLSTLKVVRFAPAGGPPCLRDFRARDHHVHNHISPLAC